MMHFSLERPTAVFLALAVSCSLYTQVASAQPVPPQNATSAESQVQVSSAANGSGTTARAVDETSTSTQSPVSPQQTQSTAGAGQTSLPPATGTALAPYEKQQGITGSKPAGAAIAPGKQRRTRSFAIRAGLLVGAAIAIGVVVGASMASPARAN